MFFIPENTIVCYINYEFVVKRLLESNTNCGVWELEDINKQKYTLKIFYSGCPLSERKKILERLTLLQNFQNLHLVPIKYFGFLPLCSSQPAINNERWIAKETEKEALLFVIRPYAKENLTMLLQEKQDIYDLLDYALQLCLGVRQLQRCYSKSPLGDLKPFFHGNLKPSNILFFTKGKKKIVKIADLGLSPCYDQDSPYLSPSQKQGLEEDLHCDIFALSKILQEMLPEAPVCILEILKDMENRDQSIKENLLGKLIETLWKEQKEIEKKRRAYSYFLLGYNLWQQGHSKYALEDFAYALSLNPSLVEALIYQGEAWKSLNHFEEALQSYNQAISIDENNALAYENRAELYAEKELYQEAILDLQKTLQLNPQSASGYGLLGMIYAQIGDLEKAIEKFTQVISLCPDSPNAYIDRAEIFAKTNQFQSAIDDYQKALSLSISHSQEIQDKIALLQKEK